MASLAAGHHPNRKEQPNGEPPDHGPANFAAMFKAFYALVAMRENPSDQQIRLR